MAVLDRIATARDDTFAARTAMNLMTLCINVMNEDPSTANHANRLLFAQKHLKGQVNSKLVAASCIAYNATLQSEIDASPTLLGANVSDGDLSYVLSSLYNNLANAYAVA
jgi:hypothetical protein